MMLGVPGCGTTRPPVPEPGTMTPIPLPCLAFAGSWRGNHRDPPQVVPRFPPYKGEPEPVTTAFRSSASPTRQGADEDDIAGA